MRNLKKLLAVIVAICVIATFTVPAFAADAATVSPDGKLCADLGVLQGDETAGGVTAAYLADNTLRWQAAVITVRLLGKEAAALATTGANFTDATDLTWKEGQNILAYLKQNPSLGWEGDAGKFDPNSKISAQMFYKVILTALGYKEGTDFQYADTITFAAGKGLTKIAAKTALTNDDMATALIEGLGAKMADGSSNLATKLVDAGVLNKDAATTAGMYSATVTATAAQTGAKAITVTFGRALSATEKTAATVSVKYGAVPYTLTATWAADSKSVVLTNSYNLIAGTYTITVGGVSAPLSVVTVAEKVNKIDLTDSSIQFADGVAIGYKVYNQFNEEMTVSAASYAFSAYDATKGKAFTIVTPTSTPKLNAKTDATVVPALGDNVIISVSNAATGVSASKSLTIVNAASVASLSFGTVAPLSGDTRVTVSKAGYVLPYTFKDQYAAAYTLPTYVEVGANGTDTVANMETIGGILFMSSDPTVVDPDTFAVDANGVLTFTAGGTAGTAIITAMVPATGVSTTVSITVNAANGLSTFVMSQPAALIVAAEANTIPYVATDSFSAPIAQKDFTYPISAAPAANKVTFVSSDATIIDVTKAADINFDLITHALTINPEKDGTVTLYAYINGVLQNSVTLVVNPVAVPTKITGLVSAPILFQALATETLKVANFGMVDQYNRAITPGVYGLAGATKTYTIVASLNATAGTHVAITNAITSANDAADILLTAGTTGSDSINFDIFDGTANVSGGTYGVTAQTVDDSAIASYALNAVPTVYDGAAGAAKFATYADAQAGAADYTQVVTLIGKDSSGNSIAVNQSKITAITSSAPSVIGTDTASKSVFGKSAGTSTVSVWNGATKLASVEVTATDAAPVATTATFDAATYTFNAATLSNLTAKLTVKDQYGVELAVDNTLGMWTSSDAAVATVVNAVGVTHGDIAKVATGSVTISFITNSGILATATVAVP